MKSSVLGHSPGGSAAGSFVAVFELVGPEAVEDPEDWPPLDFVAFKGLANGKIAWP